ncbi:MAG: trypsin-like peptidase domain-containing protein [Pseudobdellovibrio sp.]
MKTKVNELTKAARIAAKAVVRFQVHGFSESHIPSILDPRIASPEEWSGSGFFIRLNNETGYVLTNCHVARNATHIQIQSILTSDELFRLEIIGLVEGMEPDVALLKFSSGEKERFLKLSSEKKIPYLKFGDSKKISRSEEIRAIGYPLGMNEPNISGGQISNFISGSDEATERLVTDASINPGNSGGPAIVYGGKVIGINTAIIVGANNIGFITPIHLIKKVLENLETHHRTGICQLAATVQKNSATNASLLKMKNVEGLIVRKVYRNGFAASIGLRTRDVILSVNGYKIDRHGNVRGEKISRKRNIYDILYEIPLGQFVRLIISRKGVRNELLAKAINWTGEGFPSQPILRERRFICLGGLVIQEVCSEIAEALTAIMVGEELLYQELINRKSNIIVTHICDDSPAVDLDLMLGDFIIKAQGHSVKNLSNLKAVIEKAIVNKPSSFLIEFSSGAIANFSNEILSAKSAKIYKFGESAS